jgi:hypothetical protein
MHDLTTFGNQVSIEFMKPHKQLYAILGKQAWVPQEFKNKVLKHLVNYQMIRPTLKPRDIYNSKKQ